LNNSNKLSRAKIDAKQGLLFPEMLYFFAT